MAEFCLEDGALNTTTCQESSSERETHTLCTHMAAYGVFVCLCSLVRVCIRVREKKRNYLELTVVLSIDD